MNAVLDKRVSWVVDPVNVSLVIGAEGFNLAHSAVLERWQIEGRWFEDELDRRYYRVQLPDGRIGDFYENAHGQFLERWRDVLDNGGSQA